MAALLKSKLLPLILGLLLLSALNTWPAEAGEAILNFRSTILVQPDSSIIVTEEMETRCLGERIRHGIYRDIPTRYHRWPGLSTKSHFKVLQVRMDGHSSRYHIKKKGAYTRIYIGRKDYLLPHGVHNFEITYKMDGMVGFFDDYDELYWNVTGDQWKFPIEKASVRIILPEKTRFLQFASYTGRRGSKDNNARVTETGPRSIAFETTAPLMPGQGFTVAAAWPKGLINRPSHAQELMQLFWDNIYLITALMGLIVTFIYYLVVWKRVGKDPEKGPIVPNYRPPTGFGPAAARFILKMGFDNNAFSAAVINLAVKGYLTIKENSGRFTLIKNRKGGQEELSEGEKRLLNKLFYMSDEVMLTTEESSRIRSALETLKNSLYNHFERIYFKTNSKYLIPGILLSVLTLAIANLGSDDVSTAFFLSFWLAGWSAGTAFLDITAFSAIRAAIASRTLSSIGIALRSAIFAIVFTGFWFLGCFLFMNGAGTQPFVVFISLAILNLIFYQLMKAPTMRGRRVLDHIEGFRMFLETAEKDRLNLLAKEEGLPRLFEKYLPWAVALDVENQWAEKFKSYLSQAGAPQGGSNYTPAWYAGPLHHPAPLTSSLGSNISSAVSSAAISGSSGSGGGGFSGGGGGGGGGGGW